MPETPLVVVADRGRSLVPAGQTVFQRLAVEVVGAVTGVDVLAALRRHSPSLLLLGPDPPDQPLVDLIRAVRKDPSIASTPTLLVASPREPSRVGDLLAAGVLDVIYRPISALEFDRKVERLIAGRARRSRLRVLVRISTESTLDGFVTLGRSRNVSRTGCLVETDRAFEVGSRVRLRFYLPGRTEGPEARAEIVRQEPSPTGLHAYGLRFLDLPPSAAEELVEYVPR